MGVSVMFISERAVCKLRDVSSDKFGFKNTKCFTQNYESTCDMFAL